MDDRCAFHRPGHDYTYVPVAPPQTRVVILDNFRISAVIPNLPFFFCVWRSWSHYRGQCFLDGASPVFARLQPNLTSSITHSI